MASAPSPAQQAEKVSETHTQNEYEKEEQKTSGKMNEEEADAADAFAAVMGQAVTPPTPTITKVYSVEATVDVLRGLETFMRDNGITFNIQ